jgi:hypothetical protein
MIGFLSTASMRRSPAAHGGTHCGVGRCGRGGIHRPEKFPEGGNAAAAARGQFFSDRVPHQFVGAAALTVATAGRKNMA